jgi:hypothetical protein
MPACNARIILVLFSNGMNQTGKKKKESYEEFKTHAASRLTWKSHFDD